MTRIELNRVSVVYDLLSVSDYNLKRKILTGLGRRRRAQHTPLHAINNLSLEIKPDSRVGLIGANGAGKSTLLRVMAGALPPTRGRVQLDGKVFSLLGGSGTGLDFGLSGYENVILSGILLGEKPATMRSKVDEIAEFSGLGERLKNPVSSYSSGMQARLRFSILTSLSPEILIMDEGVATADAGFATKATARLTNFQDKASIVVMSSHGTKMTDSTDMVIWLDQGQIRMAGEPNEVVSSYLTWVEDEGSRAMTIPQFADPFDEDRSNTDG